MSMKPIIGSVGFVMKEENIASYAPAEETGVLVLEDKVPFPGYYEFFNFPRNKQEMFPMSVFLVLKSTFASKICEDIIIRKTKEVKKNEKLHDFDAASAELKVMNDTLIAIRIRLEEMEHLNAIIEEYKNVGVEFTKFKQIKETISRIKVRKWIEMEEKAEGICTALDQADSFYIKLPVHLNWNNFETITKKIKNNLDSVHFDAALASLYSKEGLIDFVRVYDREPSDELLATLKDKYEKECKRL